MSRRVSKDTKKKDRNIRREERKKNLKNELVRVILACEGTVELYRKKRNKTVKISNN